MSNPFLGKPIGELDSLAQKNQHERDALRDQARQIKEARDAAPVEPVQPGKGDAVAAADRAAASADARMGD